MREQSLGFIAALLLCVSPVAHAQTSWNGTWKIVNGRCGDGLKVAVDEESGAVVVKTTGTARIPSWEGRVPLGADGSGKVPYDSAAFGALELSIAHGRGKRAVTLTQQVTGVCQWKVEESVGNP